MKQELFKQKDYFKALEKVKQTILDTRNKMMIVANVERNILYYNIGKVIVEYSSWGNKFIETLSKDLRMLYPDIEGYSIRNLKYMKQFALKFPKIEIVHQVGAQISWKAIKILIDKTKTAEEHIWYTNKALENGWSSVVLAHQIDSNLYNRQAVSKKITNFQTSLNYPLNEQAKEIIKDPYIFDFIKSKGKIKELELENLLVDKIVKLLLEFGTGFAFLGRQYPIKVGDREFFIDLLFYNVKLHCYFVVELKMVDFEPEFAGKLAFYLSAIDGELKSEIDNPTIGLILCKGKNNLVCEYTIKDIYKPMGVSEYKVVNELSDELEKNVPSIEDIKERLK